MGELRIVVAEKYGGTGFYDVSYSYSLSDAIDGISINSQTGELSFDGNIPTDTEVKITIKARGN